MRLIVTGGAGFIGSALVRAAVSRGYHVLNLDCLTYAANLENLRSVKDSVNYQFLKCDIRDASAVRDAFQAFRPDAVIHLAAESHVDRSIDGPADFVATNVLGTFNLLEAFRGIGGERFLHVSTDEVYGSLGDTGFFTEDTPYSPRSPYSASKAASDHLAQAWYHTYGLPVLLTNCSNNYGPYQYPEKLIPLTILRALRGDSLPIYGDGTNVRDWLHVEDHARALLTVLDEAEPGSSYNIGGWNERTNLELVHKICECIDELRPQNAPHSDLVCFVTDRPGHDFRYAIDAGKIERELGWRPQNTIDQGLRETVSWYVENEWWWGPLVDDSSAIARKGGTV